MPPIFSTQIPSPAPDFRPAGVHQSQQLSAPTPLVGSASGITLEPLILDFLYSVYKARFYTRDESIILLAIIEGSAGVITFPPQGYHRRAGRMRTSRDASKFTESSHPIKSPDPPLHQVSTTSKPQLNSRFPSCYSSYQDHTHDGVFPGFSQC